MDGHDDPVLRVLSTVEPLLLAGSTALQVERRSPGSFFPALTGIDAETLVQMAIEVKEYTGRCWQGTRQLWDLQPVPARLYIAEFGV